MSQHQTVFWAVSASELLAQLQTTPQGLTSAEARDRLARVGANLLKPGRRTGELLILLFAAGLSFFLHDRVDALIIVGIVVASGLLGFWQERGAAHALETLLAIVKTRVVVLRDGAQVEIPVEEVVPGDVVILSAGGNVPGDCLLLESESLYIDEAALTGETFPVVKTAEVLNPDTPLNQRANTLFMGTHVVSTYVPDVRPVRVEEAPRVALRLHPQAVECPGGPGGSAPDRDEGRTGERARGLLVRRDPGGDEGGDRRAAG